MLREQGDTKIDLGSTKNYFGEHQENNPGSREKRVKFQMEPGAGDPPLRDLTICWLQTYYMPQRKALSFHTVLWIYGLCKGRHRRCVNAHMPPFPHYIFFH